MRAKNGIGETPSSLHSVVLVPQEFEDVAAEVPQRDFFSRFELPMNHLSMGQIEDPLPYQRRHQRQSRAPVFKLQDTFEYELAPFRRPP